MYHWNSNITTTWHFKIRSRSSMFVYNCDSDSLISVCCLWWWLKWICWSMSDWLSTQLELRIHISKFAGFASIYLFLLHQKLKQQSFIQHWNHKLTTKNSSKYVKLPFFWFRPTPSLLKKPQNIPICFVIPTNFRHAILHAQHVRPSSPVFVYKISAVQAWEHGDTWTPQLM